MSPWNNFKESVYTILGVVLLSSLVVGLGLTGIVAVYVALCALYLVLPDWVATALIILVMFLSCVLLMTMENED